jgi:hypothetical protein
MKPKLIKISDYKNEFFDKNSRPASSTVHAWIINGEIQGKIIGRSYYVVISDQNIPDNPIVNRVLASS